MPGMHLTTEKGYAGYEWDVHFDPRSSAFKKGNVAYLILAGGNPVTATALERADAGLTHKHPVSAVETRQELKKAGIAPR